VFLHHSSWNATVASLWWHRVISFFVLTASWFLVLTGVGNAATITVNTPDSYGRIFVDIVGAFTVDDEADFRAKVRSLSDPEKIIVTLRSEGGAFLTGLLIGDLIRLTGMATFVPAGETCTSACALVWLSGHPRLMGAGAQVGFHGAYAPASGQQLAVPNALVGTYLGYLGFSYDAVIWMISPPPGAMHWVSTETSKQYGISFQTLDSPRALPPTNVQAQQQVGSQSSPQPYTPAPAVGPSLLVAMDLHLRVQPDPRSLDILGPPPNDFIPINSAVILDGGCKVWRSPGRRDNLWCPVIYSAGDTHRGWVNAFYLLTDDGRRFACVISRSSDGCT
jgi:hypothetical protein